VLAKQRTGGRILQEGNGNPLEVRLVDGEGNEVGRLDSAGLTAIGDATGGGDDMTGGGTGMAPASPMPAATARTGGSPLVPLRVAAVPIPTLIGGGGFDFDNLWPDAEAEGGDPGETGLQLRSGMPSDPAFRFASAEEPARSLWASPAILHAPFQAAG